MRLRDAVEERLRELFDDERLAVDLFDDERLVADLLLREDVEPSFEPRFVRRVRLFRLLPDLPLEPA